MEFHEMRKATFEDVAKEIFALTLTMKGIERDQLEGTLQTLVNILRDRQKPNERL